MIVDVWLLFHDVWIENDRMIILRWIISHYIVMKVIMEIY